jgi:hypothetical protein
MTTAGQMEISSPPAFFIQIVTGRIFTVITTPLAECSPRNCSEVGCVEIDKLHLEARPARYSLVLKLFLQLK